MHSPLPLPADYNSATHMLVHTVETGSYHESRKAARFAAELVANGATEDLALAEKVETGKGAEIHVSMLQAAASWLITVLPLLDFDCDYSEITRCGNEHRKFIPTNAYPTKDGFIFMAIGSDAQWKRLCELPKFRSIANEARVTNDGRHKERSRIHADIAAITADHTAAELAAELAEGFGSPSPTHSPQVAKLSVTGTGMRSHTSVATRMLKSLADAQINVEMISTSEVRLNVVVDGPHGQKGLEELNREFANVTA